MIQIDYDKNDKDFAEKLLTELQTHTHEIMRFFNIKKVNNFKIKIWRDKQKYVNHLKTFLKNRPYQEWMIAHTYDGNINMLAFDLVQKIECHKDITTQEFIENICHEFVHICQKTVSENSSPQNDNGWYWELLATVLGNPHNFDGWKIPDFSKYSLDDLKNRFDEIDGYPIVFYMGKYLLQTKSPEQLVAWIKNDNQLDADAPTLYKETQKYYQKNN